ncbi:acyltransferase [Methylobacterium sp. Leaf113]|uniref:acyltransferase family protein n=1 Tax=Methylobacterium sp. Leaf113 TaxID=1736259 RepID=UPI000701463A|nr:acyltransferase [Methylobacterium sp. Leaf113]KQP77669.1 acyltransferase [Methylobacterium sp. Leaf113]
MIYNLQILRALAAYLVFLTHFGLYAAPILPRPDALAFGAVGVDVFFVLSGFIMFVSTAGGGETPGSFLLRRAIRVVPVYWLVTLALVLIVLAGLKPIGIVALRPDYVVQSLLFLPFSRNGYVEPLNSVGWTLNYEMFFYAGFAGLLLVASLKARLIGLVAGFLGLALLSLAPVPGLYWAYYTKPIVLEFAAGAGLGYAYLRLGQPPAGFPVRRLAGTALVAAAALVLGAQALAAARGADLEMTGFARPLVWGTAALLAVGAVVLLERGGVVLRSRWLLSQGNASYAFYLVHNLMLHSAAKAAAVLVAPGALRVVLVFVIAFGASVALGEWLFRCVEAPMGAALRRRLDRRPRSAPLTGAVTP